MTPTYIWVEDGEAGFERVRVEAEKAGEYLYEQRGRNGTVREMGVKVDEALVADAPGSAGDLIHPDDNTAMACVRRRRATKSVLTHFSHSACVSQQQPPRPKH